MPRAKDFLRSVPVEKSIGCVLCHDITEIVPGQRKGPVFRKGHMITKDDVPVLLRVGKEHIYVYEPMPGILHEDDAAKRIALALCGNNGANGITFSDISEGRINFLVDQSHPLGLLRIDTKALAAINSMPEVAVATIHTLQEVHAGQAVGGTRIIPLFIEEEKIARLESLVQEIMATRTASTRSIIEVLPLQKPSVGIVTTGSEVFHGRIKDSFGPILTKKLARYDAHILGQAFTSDDVEKTSSAITDFMEQGARLILVTGGMSVDPDDRTPSAIAHSGARIISYGAPTFPGAMFLLAQAEYAGERVHVLGLPGCVMYHKASIFELIVPRLLAGLKISQEDIAALGHGGYCTSCATCQYPLCPFGKG